MYQSSNLSFDIYGVTVTIHADDPHFLSFVKANYPCFDIDKAHEQYQINNLHIYFSQKDGKEARSRKEGLIRLGEGLYQGEHSIYWENEFGFVGHVKLVANDKWEIKGFHFNLLEDQEKEEVLKDYQRSMRWMIHFPVFCILEKFQKKRLVHASSVSKNGKAVILAGLNKVGKSSLARHLFEQEGYKYISDNFLLTNGQRVFAFPERIRLSQNSMNNLHLTPKESEVVYGKYQQTLLKEDIEMSAVPDAVFIVGNSPEIKAKKISSVRGNQTLEGMHRYLKEFPEYTFYSMLNAFGFWEKQESKPLFHEKTNFYQLTYPLNWSLQDTTKEILRCISIT